MKIKRVQFDRKSGQAFKSNAYVKFDETLVMDRFLEDVDTTKREQSRSIQSKLTSCRERIAMLTEGEHTPYEEHTATAAAFINKYRPVAPTQYSLPETLQEEGGRFSATLQSLRLTVQDLRARLDQLWANDHHMEYDLTSVFIHRGSSPSWGHYFFYARQLPERPDCWFKLNDNEVSLVSKDEVLADTTGSTANAYLLVYARKGSGVIETGKRDVTSKPGSI